MKKDIPGYEGLYAITKNGAVWSYPKTTRNRGKWLGQRENLGYMLVTLCKEKTIKTMRVHRLVAITYLSNPNNYPQINHLDGDKANNHVSNLEWCDAFRNQRHQLLLYGFNSTEKHKDVGRKNGAINAKKRRKITFQQAQEIRKLVKSGVKQKVFCDKYNLNHAIVSNIVNNKSYKEK